MNTPMSITDPRAFCRNELRPLLESDEPIRIIAISYRGIGTYRTGPVPYDIPGLQAEVYAGAVGVSDSEMLAETPASLQQRNAEARQEFEQLIENFSIELSLGERLLVFVYAGLREYRSSCRLARQIRRDHPGAVIVMVTCDCSGSEKDHAIQQLFSDGVANHLVVTRVCGGLVLMKDLLEYAVLARDR